MNCTHKYTELVKFINAKRVLEVPYQLISVFSSKTNNCRLLGFDGLAKREVSLLLLKNAVRIMQDAAITWGLHGSN
jgi:hypothetical protein